MGAAHFHFHGELLELLARTGHGCEVDVFVDDRPAVKHPIESLGVPHPEVGAIRVDGVGAGLDMRIGGGSTVEVWPVGGDAPTGCPALRPALDPPPRFVLDAHLGRLASHLRLMGFDTHYSNDADDPALAELAAGGRVLLTRDLGLLKRSMVVHGHWLRATDPTEQAIAVVRRYALVPLVRPWSRCLRCNGALQSVAKVEVLSRLEPLTRLYFDEFNRCSSCDRVYWKGSHHEQLALALEMILRRAARPT